MNNVCIFKEYLMNYLQIQNESRPYGSIVVTHPCESGPVRNGSLGSIGWRLLICKKPWLSSELSVRSEVKDGT